MGETSANVFVINQISLGHNISTFILQAIRPKQVLRVHDMDYRDVFCFFGQRLGLRSFSEAAVGITGADVEKLTAVGLPRP